MWPFRKPEDTPARRLLRRSADTPEGARILREAYYAACRYPGLTEGQCIRLVYWGVPGDA